MATAGLGVFLICAGLVRRLGLVFYEEAFAFDDDGLGVVEHAVEDGAGDAGKPLSDPIPQKIQLPINN